MGVPGASAPACGRWSRLMLRLYTSTWLGGRSTHSVGALGALPWVICEGVALAKCCHCAHQRWRPASHTSWRQVWWVLGNKSLTLSASWSLDFGGFPRPRRIVANFGWSALAVARLFSSTKTNYLVFTRSGLLWIPFVLFRGIYFYS